MNAVNWIIDKWLMQGLLTSILTGVGFLVISFTIEYIKRFKKGRQAREQEVFLQRILCGEQVLEWSNGTVRVRNSRHSLLGTNRSLPRGQHLFEQYKQCGGFLGVGQGYYNRLAEARRRLAQSLHDKSISANISRASWCGGPGTRAIQSNSATSVDDEQLTSLEWDSGVTALHHAAGQSSHMPSYLSGSPDESGKSTHVKFNIDTIDVARTPIPNKAPSPEYRLWSTQQNIGSIIETKATGAMKVKDDLCARALKEHPHLAPVLKRNTLHEAQKAEIESSHLPRTGKKSRLRRNYYKSSAKRSFREDNTKSEENIIERVKHHLNSGGKSSGLEVTNAVPGQNKEAEDDLMLVIVEKKGTNSKAEKCKASTSANVLGKQLHKCPKDGTSLPPHKRITKQTTEKQSNGIRTKKETSHEKIQSIDTPKHVNKKEQCIESPSAPTNKVKKERCSHVKVGSISSFVVSEATGYKVTKREGSNTSVRSLPARGKSDSDSRQWSPPVAGTRSELFSAGEKCRFNGLHARKNRKYRRSQTPTRSQTDDSDPNERFKKSPQTWPGSSAMPSTTVAHQVQYGIVVKTQSTLKTAESKDPSTSSSSVDYHVTSFEEKIAMNYQYENKVSDTHTKHDATYTKSHFDDETKDAVSSSISGYIRKLVFGETVSQHDGPCQSPELDAMCNLSNGVNNTTDDTLSEHGVKLFLNTPMTTIEESPHATNSSSGKENTNCSEIMETQQDNLLILGESSVDPFLKTNKKWTNTHNTVDHIQSTSKTKKEDHIQSTSKTKKEDHIQSTSKTKKEDHIQSTSKTKKEDILPEIDTTEKIPLDNVNSGIQLQPETCHFGTKTDKSKSVNAKSSLISGIGKKKIKKKQTSSCSLTRQSIAQTSSEALHKEGLRQSLSNQGSPSKQNIIQSKGSSGKIHKKRQLSKSSIDMKSSPNMQRTKSNIETNLKESTSGAFKQPMRKKRSQSIKVRRRKVDHIIDKNVESVISNAGSNCTLNKDENSSHHNDTSKGLSTRESSHDINNTDVKITQQPIGRKRFHIKKNQRGNSCNNTEKKLAQSTSKSKNRDNSYGRCMPEVKKPCDVKLCQQDKNSGSKCDHNVSENKGPVNNSSRGKSPESKPFVKKNDERETTENISKKCQKQTKDTPNKSHPRLKHLLKQESLDSKSNTSNKSKNIPIQPDTAKDDISQETKVETETECVSKAKNVKRTNEEILAIRKAKEIQKSRNAASKMLDNYNIEIKREEVLGAVVSLVTYHPKINADNNVKKTVDYSGNCRYEKINIVDTEIGGVAPLVEGTVPFESATKGPHSCKERLGKSDVGIAESNQDDNDPMANFRDPRINISVSSMEESKESESHASCRDFSSIEFDTDSESELTYTSKYGKYSLRLHSTDKTKKRVDKFKTIVDASDHKCTTKPFNLRPSALDTVVKTIEKTRTGENVPNETKTNSAERSCAGIEKPEASRKPTVSSNPNIELPCPQLTTPKLNPNVGSKTVNRQGRTSQNKSNFKDNETQRKSDQPTKLSHSKLEENLRDKTSTVKDRKEKNPSTTLRNKRNLSVNERTQRMSDAKTDNRSSSSDSNKHQRNRSESPRKRRSMSKSIFQKNFKESKVAATNSPTRNNADIQSATFQTSPTIVCPKVHESSPKNNNTGVQNESKLSTNKETRSTLGETKPTLDTESNSSCVNDVKSVSDKIITALTRKTKPYNRVNRHFGKDNAPKSDIVKPKTGSQWKQNQNKTQTVPGERQGMGTTKNARADKSKMKYIHTDNKGNTSQNHVPGKDVHTEDDKLHARRDSISRRRICVNRQSPVKLQELDSVHKRIITGAVSSDSVVEVGDISTDITTPMIDVRVETKEAKTIAPTQVHVEQDLNNVSTVDKNGGKSQLLHQFTDRRETVKENVASQINKKTAPIFQKLDSSLNNKTNTNIIQKSSLTFGSPSNGGTILTNPKGHATMTDSILNQQMHNTSNGKESGNGVTDNSAHVFGSNASFSVSSFQAACASDSSKSCYPEVKVSNYRLTGDGFRTYRQKRSTFEDDD